VTEVYRRISFRPFRMHFQFLMANDLPGEYDFMRNGRNEIRR
jgi:hypothetical protein